MAFRPAPAGNQPVHFKGTVLHYQGKWGLKRPVRRSALINYFVREPSVGLLPGAVHQLDWQITDGDGNFSVFATAQGIPQTATMVEDVIEIQFIPSGQTETIVLDDLPWGTSTVKEVGPFTFSWAPAEPTVGEIDGKPFDGVQGFANQLAETLMLAQPKPYSARKASIVLLREPSEFEEYTRAQQLPANLKQADIHKDYPTKLFKLLETIPMLRTGMKSAHDAHLNYLFKISKMQSYQFERGSFLSDVIKGIGKSLGWIVSDTVSDPIPDAAACAVMIFIAGRMAKDGGGMMNLSFGKRAFTWSSSHTVKTVELLVGR